MTEYKRLDIVIGAGHFRDIFVCTDIERVVAERRPKYTEFLSGRIVPLDGYKSMLILVFEQIMANQKHPVSIPIKLEKHDGDLVYYSIAQTDDRITVIS